MKVQEIELKASAYSPKDFPDWGIPEVSFLGRSNVGKSSLINKLTGRKNIARISSTPGKTRGLYFYLLNNRLCFVDLPGYGYAKVSKTERQRWAPLIEEYLSGRDTLAVCIHLVDCRHAPSADDKMMSEWLRFHQVPSVTVATKSDKLSRGALLKQLAMIKKQLGLLGEDLLLPFSAQTGAGRDQLWQAITSRLAE